MFLCLDMHTAYLIADLERRFDEHPDPGWASRPGACDPSLAERLLSGSRRTRTQEGPARPAAPREDAAAMNSMTQEQRARPCSSRTADPGELLPPHSPPAGADAVLFKHSPRSPPRKLRHNTYMRVIMATAGAALLSFALNIPFHVALAIGSVAVLSAVLVGAYNHRVRSLPRDARARWNRTPGGFSLPVRAAVFCVLSTAGVLYLKVHISPRSVGLAAICAGFAVPGLDALVRLAQLRRRMISESFSAD